MCGHVGRGNEKLPNIQHPNILFYSTPLASKVHCSINGLENSSSSEYSQVQQLFGIAVGLFAVGVGLFFVRVGLFYVRVGLEKSPPLTKKSPPLAKKSPPPTKKSPPLTEKSHLESPTPTMKRSPTPEKKSNSNPPHTENVPSPIIFCKQTNRLPL